jgi:hypothetical protein
VSKTREQPLGAVQQRLDAFVVHHLGAVDPGFKHESLRIYEQVALSALHLFPAIVAAFFPAHPGRLDRLAVHYPRAGLRVSLQTNPRPLAQGGMHPLPGAIQAEPSEVVVDAAPGWEIVGKQAPGAAAPHDVEDGVKDLAQRVDSRAPGGFGSGKVGLQASPFGVGKVGWICPSHAC